MVPLLMTLSDLYNLKVTITPNNSTTTKSCMIYPMVPFPVNLSDP